MIAYLPSSVIRIQLMIPDRQDIIIQHREDMVGLRSGLRGSGDEARAIVMIASIPVHRLVRTKEERDCIH